MFTDAFKKLLSEKSQLLDTIQRQMQPDAAAGRLSDRALECFNNAKLSLAGVEQQRIINTEESHIAALQLFWRTAWNLGELMALKPKKE